MPNLTWYGSPNFTPGRTDVEYVVIHWMDGYLAGADATFQNTVRQTSAHYGVEDDTIHQYVDEANTAWHAGNWDANTRSIGVEHSAMPGRDASDSTYASTIWLITGICQRYGLDPAVAILPHQHFTSTDCPGTMDLPRIIAGVQASLGGIGTQASTITPISPIQEVPDLDTAQNAALAEAWQNSKDIKAILGRVAQIAEALDVQINDRTHGNVRVAAEQIQVHLTSQHTDEMNALVSIAQAVGALKNAPAAAAPTIDVPALASQIAAALSTNQAHDFLVAFHNALPAQ